MLARHGYAVLEASDAVEALLIAERHQGSLDLLITDVVLPGSSGCALAKHLRHLRPLLPVLYMSGHTDEVVLSHGVSQSHSALLHKPFTAGELMDHVRAVLDAPAGK
jgi:DNA-binding response OmpR family regulator